MTGPRDPRQPHTRFSGCVIFTCLNPTNPQTKTERVVQTSTTHPLLWDSNQTSRNDDPPQRTPFRTQNRVQSTRPGCKIGTTHPLWRAPFLCENPPDEHTASPQYAQPPKPKGPAPRNDNRRTCVPHTRFSGFLPPMKTHLTSTRASPQPSPSTKTPAQRNLIQEPAIMVQKTSTTHPLRRVCGNFKFVIWTQHPRPTERTRENNDPPAKRIPRTAMSRNHDASPGRTPHPPKRVWYSPEPASPNRSHNPAEGNPNGEARNDVPGTTHPPKRYHTPARAGVWCY
ncbi:hypothetical protein BS47DRAFT_1361992 [Hydnum rufescens UP504]|uniref:Uncharacterized protein n=1 Tax=Hydnum rufescens UP504 TaxID=1448309 RepID=A0A9P6DXM1_9AGAM|nr:hypothetical protein BS47DRAFT_1361992 [Hydnum rufescens UP504]